MPGSDLAYQAGGPDLYPADEDAHARLLAWCNDAFTAAKAAKQTREDRWRKYHRAYRSYVERDAAASWRSAMYVPYTFSVIESVTPRMVAQLPVPICEPVGPEDVIPAKLMQEELRRCMEQTDLYVELVKSIKTSLKYGTGLLKNFYHTEIGTAHRQVPAMQEVTITDEEPEIDPASGQQMNDIDGEAIFTSTTRTEMQPVLDEMGQPQMTMEPYEFLIYSGPKSTWVDPFHFWVAPDADSLDGARYTIERVYRDMGHVQKLIDAGVYRLPPGMNIEETYPADEGVSIRAEEAGDDAAAKRDPTRRAVELLEYHTSDKRVITVLNSKAVIRVAPNPFQHGQKPYAYFPDYLQEGEFWGIGEVEAIEGLQDLLNALYNQRVDNSRLSMNAMYAVNTKAIEDERDLLLKPGGIIRIAGDYTPQEALQRLDLGDVSGSAFEEAAQVERLIERVSGVSAYQLGITDEGVNRTATGVSLITEAGNTKFALKVRLMEMIGMRRVISQWGSIVQQFTDVERTVRVMGPQGQWLFPTLTPESIQGNLDYRIDVASSTQTETVAKEQATMLFQTLAPALPMAVPKLAQDLLEAFGKKDLMPYFMGSPDLTMLSQMMQAQSTGGVILPFPAPGETPPGGAQAQPQGPTQAQGPAQGQGQGAGVA